MTIPDTSAMTRMLQTHPRGAQVQNQQALLACIEACFECAQVCTACADACLAEPDVQMVIHCIRLNLDCADICNATGRVLARQTEPQAEVVRDQLRACLTACQACGTECRKHAGHHEHCGVCGESCRRCEQACQNLLSTLSA
ncbi:hypothetical protein SAMN04488058_1483 [Deinococcus reticulitermitis]|uniref:Four-helix bundle copper-binding protein n=2 Tax=Deinococcus TaxID=1298 RepID=A0A7X1NZ56_9DEIO|nr:MULTISPECIES: four-helix bundle copper-binding protein [Deinococcus]MPY67994.1 four-helix bundle copper-binding protein [Deinococcus terrestris]SEJ94444.1 hypothetical protein SAMN04488058_1483 [Deinococcus reticulitermitis]